VFAQVENEHSEDENSNMADHRFGMDQMKIQLSPEGYPATRRYFPLRGACFFLFDKKKIFLFLVHNTDRLQYEYRKQHC
jgi:hypothetical protein